MVTYFWIGLGGALGSIARFWISELAVRFYGETFPWGTILVNVSGSLLIGFFFTLTSPGGRFWAGPDTRQFVMFGVLGSYTTFSTFSLQTLILAREGEWLKAGGNCLASVGFCLLAVWLGHILALALIGHRNQ